MRVKILEAKGPKSFENDSGETVAYNNAIVRMGEREIKVKVAGDLDVTEYVEKEVTCLFKIAPGRNQSPTFELVSVEEPKVK